MNLLKPQYRFNRITDITVEDLEKNDIKLVLLDADNTLSFHGSHEPFPGVLEWIDEIKKNGIVPVIISNNKEQRIKPFAEKMGLDFISEGKKPLPQGFMKACEKYGIVPEKTAVIGDQIFTDVLGGNLIGAKVFLTEPLGKETDNFIKFKRKIEKLIR